MPRFKGLPTMHQPSGAWVRRMREKLGLSQQGLGRYLGHEGRWVSRVEMGHVRAGIVHYLAIRMLVRIQRKGDDDGQEPNDSRA